MHEADEWRPISKLTLHLDDEGLSDTFLLRNGDQVALGLFCDLGPAAKDGDDELPPTAGWYDTHGKPLAFTPAFYKPASK